MPPTCCESDRSEMQNENDDARQDVVTQVRHGLLRDQVRHPGAFNGRLDVQAQGKHRPRDLTESAVLKQVNQGRLQAFHNCQLKSFF